MVYLLFVCSGLSGLIYQVVWVRAFGNVFGNTIYSASLVVAVFMLGLGAGSFAAGAWADRRYRLRPDSLLRAFGVVELAVGALALGLSALLPHLGDLSARFSSYTPGPDGWYILTTSSYVGRAALAVGLLAPITLLMGGTLTLLVRHVVGRELPAGGWRIALLYAANTTGAAVGCFLTDFALVPAFGFQRTQLVAFAFNVAAALGAFSLARGATVRLKPDTTYIKKDARGDADVRSVRLQPDPTTAWTSLAIALSGFAAMGMEIVWFRHFSIVLGEYRAVFSLLLTVILCGIGAGALAGGWLQRRVGRPVQMWMLVQGLFVASTLLGLVSIDARQIRDWSAGQLALDGWARSWAEVWFNAAPIIAVAGLPSLLMGFAFPLANAAIQCVESRVGRRAGVLYLANTAGAVGGSLATGFLLLPMLGIQASTTLLVSVSAGGIAPLYLAGRADRPGPWPLAGSLTVAAASLGLWLLLPSDALIAKEMLFPLEKAYAVSEGLTEVIAVTDGPDGGRVLVTNGHPMSSTELFSQRYMRAMAHIPLLSLDSPTRVLVLCYGVGNTAHAATLHPTVERVDIVDLSAHVLRHSSYFSDVNHDVLRDPRVAVYVNDGRDHLRMQAAGSYDLITLEPPPIVHAGVAGLYSREFYRSARSRLTPGGYLSQWLPVFGVPHDTILSMIRAFVDVFPNAVLLSGANTNLLLIGANDARNTIDPGRVAAALLRAPAVQADLRRLDLGSPREIVGTFVASTETLVAATRESPPVTDDRPIQEYGKRSLLDFGEGGIPPSVIAVNQVAAWCPACFSGGTPVALVDGIETYLAMSDLAYRAADGGAGLTRGRTVAGSGYLGSIVPESPELQRLLGTTADRQTPPAGAADAQVRERYARATALLEAGRFAEAVEQFRAVLELAPGSVEALNNMGVALASLGRLDEAIDRFRQSLALRPDFADAQRNLDFALEKAR
ncbi:MAG: tetratricopeptide repeat protein [Acidobacteria bacterium]|nr:tetratricopeptide repeat protein [Acidobacteriota bacterium]